MSKTDQILLAMAFVLLATQIPFDVQNYYLEKEKIRLTESIKRMQLEMETLSQSSAKPNS